MCSCNLEIMGGGGGGGGIYLFVVFFFHIFSVNFFPASILR